MGGVCSAGVPRKRDEVDVEVEHGKDSSGFSGKLKSMASLGKKNKVEESYPTYPDMDMFDRIPNYLYDSTELGLTISRELKPSTPARTTAHKLHRPAFC
ncbi:hypothetical protein Leryth_010622 [Lithospermum erythrorhizon]|nr:hypothetical protein Leryth_010622 [Lithospermum erythrorhizon]